MPAASLQDASDMALQEAIARFRDDKNRFFPCEARHRAAKRWLQAVHAELQRRTIADFGGYWLGGCWIAYQGDPGDEI